jgi:uncharacterized HAD superfamily protein
MLIAVDIDGVCANTLPLMREVLNDHFGKEYTPETCTEYLFTELYGPDAYSVLRPRYKDIFRAAEPVPGAAETLSRLAAEGVGIIYLTSRYTDTSEVTTSWIWRHGFPTGQVLHTVTKDGVALSFKARLVIEDSPIEAVRIARYIKVVLFDYAYNRHLHDPWISRVTSWEDAERCIREYLRLIPGPAVQGDLANGSQKGSVRLCPCPLCQRTSVRPSSSCCASAASRSITASATSC